MAGKSKNKDANMVARTTLADLKSDLGDIATRVVSHETTLRGKNGEVGLVARVKTLEEMASETKWWLRAIALMIVAEIVARFAGVL